MHTAHDEIARHGVGSCHAQELEEKLQEKDRVKSALDLTISDLRQKHASSRSDVAQERAALRAANRSIM